MTPAKNLAAKPKVAAPRRTAPKRAAKRAAKRAPKRTAQRTARPAGKAPAAAANESATRVLRRFRLVFNAVKTHFREVEKKAGVAGAQLWALSVIREQPGVGVTDLARAMDVHQSTASNLVRTLVAQDLVRLMKNGIDRRTVQLHLSPSGARALRRAPGPFEGVLPAALGSLDKATLARLEKDLAQLIAVLGIEDERGARIPLGQT